MSSILLNFTPLMRFRIIIYNNKTLDMKFIKDVKAKYLSSNLFAQKADYSNSERYLNIYDNGGAFMIST